MGGIVRQFIGEWRALGRAQIQFDEDQPVSDHSKPAEDQAPASLASIGREVGVDPSLVSRVLRGDPQARVSLAKRQQILDVAKRTGYRPNRVARSLRTQRTNILAMLTPDITNPFHSWLYRAVEASANRAGYEVILCNTDDDLERARSVVTTLCEGHVDGVLLATARQADSSIELLRQLNIPYVLMNRRREEEDETWFGTDSASVGRMGCKLLLDMGHRRIAYLDGDPSTEQIAGRTRGYVAALSEAGVDLPPQFFATSVATRAESRDAARKLIALPDNEKPTAFLVPSSMLIDGVLSAVHAAGLRIPEDISILGLSAVAHPDVSSIRVPVEEIGQKAVEWLIARLDRSAEPPPVVRRAFEVAFIDRGSVAPPRR